MHLFTIRKAAIAAAAVAALAVNASPANAAGSSPLLRAANSTSTGQAGYFVLKPPVSGSATTSFTVPGLKCPASGLLGVGPGVWIFTGTSTSPNASAASLFIGCQSGVVFYQPEIVINGVGTIPSVTVSKGDKITTTVSVSATKVSATFADTTKHFTKTLTGSGAKPAAILDGIDSLVSGSQLPVPNFGVMAFTASLIDGKTLKAAAAKPYDMATTTHVLQIKTGPLDVTGKNFTETYKHS